MQRHVILRDGPEAGRKVVVGDGVCRIWVRLKPEKKESGFDVVGDDEEWACYLIARGPYLNSKFYGYYQPEPEDEYDGAG